MSNHVPRPTSEPARRLSVLRVAENSKEQILVLADGPVKGFITHFTKGQSQACRGEECGCQSSMVNSLWKGYHPVMRFDRQGNCWIPTVLEVTEALELDFRGKFFRGQEWELSRGIITKKRKPAIFGRLIGSRDLPEHCRAFDVSPAVFWIYHDRSLKINLSSPIPQRVMVEPLTMNGPGQHDQAEKKATPEQLANLRKRLGGFLGNGAKEIGAMPEGGDQ